MFLTVRQVAERLSVSRATVYGLVSSGALVCSRIGVGRGTIRISENELERFIETASKPQIGRVSARDLSHLKL
jgi:excisionase family DNA binding protein